jgi:lysozyme
MPTLFGVDVSAFQGRIDWPSVATAGISFTIARCVVENRTVDSEFARNLAGARAAGLIPGAYAFLAGGGVARTMAKTLIDTIGDPTGMLVALDIERPTFHAVPTRADVDAFVDAWKLAHPNHPLLLYGSAKALISTLGHLADHGLFWMAWYPGGKGTAPAGYYASIGGDGAAQWKYPVGGWTGPSIWQFTSSGVRVAGIADANGNPKRVDTNAFRGDRSQLLGLTGVAGPAGPGAPNPIPAPTVAPAQPPPAPAPGSTAQRFHTVVPGDTMSGIAAQFGFKPSGGQPAFRVMLNAFPENASFRSNPGLIRPGQRVRVG